MEKINEILKIVKLLGIGALVILSLLFFKGCKDREYLESKLKMQDNNINALKDTVRVEKTKSGKLQYVKTAFMSDIKDLKTLNSSLFEEVKDQKQKVFFISQTVARISDDVKKISKPGEHSYDPVTGNDAITWNFDTIGNGWSRKLSGKTEFKITSSCTGYNVIPKNSFIEKLDYKFKLTTGLKKSEKYPESTEIFINSNYPGMKFDSISGAIVNPEELKKFLPVSPPKRWSIGPYVGIGYGATLAKPATLYPVISIGLGLQYKLINF